MQRNIAWAQGASASGVGDRPALTTTACPASSAAPLTRGERMAFPTLRIAGRRAVPRVKGCAVAASMAGVKAPGDLSGVALAKPEAPSGRERKRYTQDNLRRKDTWPSP